MMEIYNPWHNWKKDVLNLLNGLNGTKVKYINIIIDSDSNKIQFLLKNSIKRMLYKSEKVSICINGDKKNIDIDVPIDESLALMVLTLDKFYLYEYNHFISGHTYKTIELKDVLKNKYKYTRMIN